MPSSTVRTFTDPDDYASAIRATKAEITVTGRGKFAANIIKIDLHDLWMQRFSDNLPRVAHSAAITGRAIISFPTEPGPDLVWSGAELRLGSIVRHSEGQGSFQRSWGSAYLGCDVATDGDLGFYRTSNYRLRSDTAERCINRCALGHRNGTAPAAARGGRGMAEEAPEIIANPDAARGLEQALIEVMAASLGGGEARGRKRSALRQHALVMRRFRRATGGGSRSAALTCRSFARRSAYRTGHC